MRSAGGARCLAEGRWPAGAACRRERSAPHSPGGASWQRRRAPRGLAGPRQPGVAAGPGARIRWPGCACRPPALTAAAPIGPHVRRSCGLALAGGSAVRRGRTGRRLRRAKGAAPQQAGRAGVAAARSPPAPGPQRNPVPRPGSGQPPGPSPVQGRGSGGVQGRNGRVAVAARARPWGSMFATCRKLEKKRRAATFPASATAGGGPKPCGQVALAARTQPGPMVRSTCQRPRYEGPAPSAGRALGRGPPGRRAQARPSGPGPPPGLRRCAGTRGTGARRPRCRSCRPRSPGPGCPRPCRRCPGGTTPYRPRSWTGTPRRRSSRCRSRAC